MAAVVGAVVGGRYQLVGLIGQGGMGRVWRGWDTTLGRDVAVKEVLLPQGVTDAEREQLVQRVLREARAAARLNHPGIITVHDVAEYEGAPVIVMEFVDGESLAAAVARGGALPVARVAELGAAMVKALLQAHGAGIVHRDLKPDNVLLMGERVILTDFGIAHMADATTALTRTGAVIGTPAYMAPEQLEGRPAAPANDLWALGATLYSAVEGEAPFSGDTFGALCVAVVTKEPRPAVRAGALAPLLGALLAKDPAARPSAEQALAALEAVARAGAGAAGAVAPGFGAFGPPPVMSGGVPLGPVRIPPQVGPGPLASARPTGEFPHGGWQDPVAVGWGSPIAETAAPVPVPAPAPVPERSSANPAVAVLVRFIGCLALIWTVGSVLPWNYLDRVVGGFTPLAMAITGVLALANALPRPRWHPAAVWVAAVVADFALWYLTAVLLEVKYGGWFTGFGELPWQIAVNMLLLGTGAWLLWMFVPGSRRRS
ncbi:serine/threonine-protein kinase [Kitasatospora purpeofusca]|uniref:serine/threonine-protein kinase n=1 Tax=Kitasatospora purpeofusca TaxID=67352 RepID=UPI002A5AB00F|nr:serine/threonine-protein kinase [Kitasatospora purpeofusca]MDY0811213.1 serine/threonine-protein kinase [Kitasatospora purpeofusca]